MLPLISVACKKETASPPYEMTGLRIAPYIVSSASVESSAAAFTRSAVNGLFNGFTVGLAVTKAGDPKVEYLPGYRNIRAFLDNISNVNLWDYKPAGATASTPQVGVYKNNGAVDLYGFYPYNPEVADITAIPFEVGNTNTSNMDYMWATPILGIDPSVTVTPLAPKLNHVMTLLYFDIKVSYAGPLLLKNIKLEASDKIFKLRGTYDASNDGKISIKEEDKSNILIFNWNAQLAASTSISILFPEISVAADDNTTISVSMYFDNDKMLYDGGGDNNAFTFKLKDVVTNTSNFGFMRGSQYQLSIKIDNFVKYEGYPNPVVRDWTTIAEDPIIF